MRCLHFCTLLTEIRIAHCNTNRQFALNAVFPSNVFHKYKKCFFFYHLKQSQKLIIREYFAINLNNKKPLVFCVYDESNLKASG